MSNTCDDLTYRCEDCALTFDGDCSDLKDKAMAVCPNCGEAVPRYHEEDEE